MTSVHAAGLGTNEQIFLVSLEEQRTGMQGEVPPALLEAPQKPLKDCL